MNIQPVVKTIDDLILENKIKLYNDENFYYIQKNNKIIKISFSHKIYIKTLMRFFEIHFDAVESELIDGNFVVDFSYPKEHKVIGFDLFDLYCPSLAETYETASQYLDYANLDSGDVVLDLGAYSGLTSILFAQKVGNNGKVIAVEADELNFSCLLKNVNKLKENANIECLNAAVWNYSGDLEFSTEESMGSSAVSIVGQRGRIKTVDCYTLNDICKKYNLQKVDFIKCDIEGAESCIFEDDDFFSKFNPKIIVETHIVDGKFCDDICIKHLAKYGYNHKRIVQSGLDMPLLEFIFEKN
jgi:FkbM family methyltransferase